MQPSTKTSGAETRRPRGQHDALPMLDGAPPKLARTAASPSSLPPVTPTRRPNRPHQPRRLALSGRRSPPGRSRPEPRTARHGVAASLLLPRLGQPTSVRRRPPQRGSRASRRRLLSRSGLSQTGRFPMATRRSRRSGAPGAAPDDRDCPRGVHGASARAAAFVPQAATRTVSSALAVRDASRRNRQRRRARSRCRGFRDFVEAAVSLTVVSLPPHMPVLASAILAWRPSQWRPASRRSSLRGSPGPCGVRPRVRHSNYSSATRPRACTSRGSSASCRSPTEPPPRLPGPRRQTRPRSLRHIAGRLSGTGPLRASVQSISLTPSTMLSR